MPSADASINMHYAIETQHHSILPVIQKMGSIVHRQPLHSRFSRDPSDRSQLVWISTVFWLRIRRLMSAHSSGSPETVTPRSSARKKLVKRRLAELDQTCKQGNETGIPMTLNCLSIKQRSAEISADSGSTDRCMTRRSFANSNQRTSPLDFAYANSAILSDGNVLCPSTT